MEYDKFLTGQDVLDSYYAYRASGMEKDAGWIAAAGRRMLTAIPRMFMGRNFGLQGTMRGINRLLGGGKTRMARNGAAKVFSTGGGRYATNTGSFMTDTWNKTRNWILDKTHAADKYLGRKNKALDSFTTAADEAAFGPKYKTVVENIDGKEVTKQVLNKDYKQGLATASKVLGGVGGLAGYSALSSVPVVGDVLDVVDTVTPAGAIESAVTSIPGAIGKTKNYIADKYVIPTATNAAYNAMNSTLQGVNNMTTAQRLGFLLAPQQAQRQMQAQAEQEFARQAWAQQQEIWRQRRA